MAKKVKVKINGAGAVSVLTSGGVSGYLQSHGQRTVEAANAMLGPIARTDMYPYRLSVWHGSSRARVSVGTGGFTSRRDNAKNNTLLKALGG